jgi:hypothetical protein
LARTAGTNALALWSRDFVLDMVEAERRHLETARTLVRDAERRMTALMHASSALERGRVPAELSVAQADELTARRLRTRRAG